MTSGILGTDWAAKSVHPAISGRVRRAATRVACSQSINFIKFHRKIFRPLCVPLLTAQGHNRWSFRHALPMCITSARPSVAITQTEGTFSLHQQTNHSGVRSGSTRFSARPLISLLRIRATQRTLGHGHNDDEFSPLSLTTVTVRRGNLAARRDSMLLWGLEDPCSAMQGWCSCAAQTRGGLRRLIQIAPRNEPRTASVP